MKIEITNKGTMHQMTMVNDIQGDMGEDTRLHLIQQPDGDVIICLSNTENYTRESIEFCSVSGGGRNPFIVRKLQEIIQYYATPTKGEE